MIVGNSGEIIVAKAFEVSDSDEFRWVLLWTSVRHE
jgi:hypothetical protein